MISVVQFHSILGDAVASVFDLEMAQKTEKWDFFKAQKRKMASSYGIWATREIIHYAENRLYPRKSGYLHEYIQIMDDFYRIVTQCLKNARDHNKECTMFLVLKDVISNTQEILYAMKGENDEKDK